MQATRTENSGTSPNAIIVQLRGDKIDKKDTFGKSGTCSSYYLFLLFFLSCLLTLTSLIDPFLKIYARNKLVYRSEVRDHFLIITTLFFSFFFFPQYFFSHLLFLKSFLFHHD